MTNGERKALAFLAGVGVLGSAARVALAPDRAPTRAERLALAGQLDAVDSARRAGRGGEDGAPSSGRRRRGSARAPASPRPSAPVRSAPALSVPERSTSPTALVDVDVADEAALVGLPGIGPGLGRRIVVDRAERGAFGSLSGLDRVRGVGPKLAARLAAHVTFSGAPRPSSAAVERPP